MAGLVPADTLKDYIGKDMGESDWLEIDQDRINQFADATLDHQFIHVDSEKATPLFGSTIAHGFLSLSLTAGMPAPQVAPENMTMAFNYGLDRVRFLTPVNVGSKVRSFKTCLLENASFVEVDVDRRCCFQINDHKLVVVIPDFFLGLIHY